MLHALIDNIPDFMYVKDLESRFVVANPHLAHVVGVKTTEELLGKTDYDFYPRNLADGFYEDEQNVILSGQPLHNREEKGVDSQGNEVDILTTKVAQLWRTKWGVTLRMSALLAATVQARHTTLSVTGCSQSRCMREGNR